MIIYEAYTKPPTTIIPTATTTSSTNNNTASTAAAKTTAMKKMMKMKIIDNNSSSSSSSSSSISKKTITNESIEIFKTYESFHINTDDEDCDIDDNARLPGIRIDPIGHFLFIDCINHYVEMEKLQSICCPIKNCKFLRFPSNDLLVKHVTDVHKNLFYCELCLNHRPLFIIEHRLMNKKQLQDHMDGINSCCDDVVVVDDGNLLLHHQQQQQQQVHHQQQQYQQFCGIIDDYESYNLKYGSNDASYDANNRKGDHTVFNNIINQRTNDNNNKINNNKVKNIKKNHNYCLFDEHTVAHPKCLFCNKYFFDQSALYTHMQCMYFTCHLCPAKFMFR
jgi:hypothetical protein